MAAKTQRKKPTTVDKDVIDIGLEQVGVTRG